MKIRVKNKGSQKRVGRQRQKYQAPVPEHPHTTEPVSIYFATVSRSKKLLETLYSQLFRQ